MPTASLAQTIAEVRKRITSAGARGLNEQNTKATLIEPFLWAIGWDTDDVDESPGSTAPRASARTLVPTSPSGNAHPAPGTIRR